MIDRIMICRNTTPIEQDTLRNEDFLLAHFLLAHFLLAHFLDPSPATTGSRSLIPAVAWVVGCFAIFIVVLVGVACSWYIKRRKNNSVKMGR